MNMYLLIILCYFTQVLTRDCSLFSGDYTKIVAKNSEVITNPISNFFSEITNWNDLKLTDPNNKLTLIPPIQLTSSETFPPESTLEGFMSFSVFTNIHYDWLNKFQLLGHKGNKYVFLSTTQIQPGTQQRLPVFNTEDMLEDLTAAIYYSSAMLHIGHIIIDCSKVDQQVESNYFLLIDQVKATKTMMTNIYPYKNQQNRQIKCSEKYIYRATLNNDQNPSIIEIFSFNEEYQTVQLWNTIDQKFILNYVTNITDYKFELQDFKIGKQDEIVILDKSGNLLFFQYSKEKFVFYFYFIAYQLGESVSFDYDFYRQYYAVIQPHKLVSYFSTYNRIYETTDDISAAKVHLGKDLLFMTSSTQIILFNALLEVDSKLQGDFSWTLSDYNQNDFVSITVNSIKHYQLYGQYYLQYMNKEQTSGSGTLILKGCSVTIDYQNVEAASTSLIYVSKGPLLDTPLFSNTFSQWDIPRHLVDGPKQQLTIQPDNGGNISSISYFGDHVTTDINFKASDYIFIQTSSTYYSQDQPYFIVTQKKNKILVINYCNLFLDYQSCTIYSSIQLQCELNNKNAIISQTFGSLTVAILESPIRLVIHQFLQDGTHSEYGNDIKEEYEIDSFYLSGINMILFSKNLFTLRIYFFTSMTFQYTITPEDMKNLGIVDWNPTRIFTSDIDGWVFVFNNDQQIVTLKLGMNYYSVVYIWSVLPCKDLRIMSFSQRFGLIQQFDNGKISFNIFNRVDETNIYLEKSPSFYSYRIKDLDSIFYVAYNGVVNVKATRDSDNSAVVLTYLVDQTDHNSLHSVVVLDKSNVFLSCTQNNIFFFNEANVAIMYIRRTPNVVSKVQFDDNTFVTDVKYNLVYSNEMILIIPEQFRLANTYLELKINKDKVNTTIDLSQNKQDHVVTDMGDDWYSGEVASFQLTFPQVNNETTIINPIELVKNNYENDTKNVADLDADHLFVLKNETFIIMSKKSNEKVKTYSFITDFLCEDILGYNGGQFLLQCTYQTKIVIAGVKCEGQVCTLGTTFLETNENIIRTQIEDDAIFLVYRQRVEAYGGSILSLDKVVLYGFEDFSGLDNFQYGITIQKIYNTHYHIYCTDYNRNFVILEYVLATNTFTRNNKFTFDLAAFINKDFYILKDVWVSQISIINVQLAINSFKADYILFSTKGPHYGIHMEFTCENDKCQLATKNIAFILQGYGSYELYGYLFPQITIRQNLVIIPYSSSNREKIIVSVYNLPTTQTTKSAVIFFGALRPSYFDIRRNLLQECYFYNKQAYLLTNAESFQLSLYKINYSPQLMLNGQVNSVTGLLKILNDYSSDQIFITINAPGPNDDNNSSHTAIWVVLGIIIGGAIIIGVGYYCLKRKQRKVETLI